MIDQLPALTAEALPAELMERLRQGAHDARGTMAIETDRALRRAFGAFLLWCNAQGLSPLPAQPMTVAGYIDHLAAIPGRKASGIRQACWAIGAMHRLSQSSDPTKAEPVRLALKRMSRQLGTRQQQAAPIGHYEVQRIIETAGSKLGDFATSPWPW
jgi:hypothetical protein